MDNLRFMRLWDLYKELLTPTQREITDLYFNLDLTVSEIAEQKGISRQAVYDCLAGCKKQLESYEEKLRFEEMLASENLQFSSAVKEISEWGGNFFAVHPDFSADFEQLKAILNKFVD